MSILELRKCLIGTELSEAEEIAKTAGKTIRIVKQDNKHRMATCDFLETRVNVAVLNGVISEVIFIG